MNTKIRETTLTSKTKERAKKAVFPEQLSTALGTLVTKCLTVYDAEEAALRDKIITPEVRKKQVQEILDNEKLTVQEKEEAIRSTKGLSAISVINQIALLQLHRIDAKKNPEKFLFYHDTFDTSTEEYETFDAYKRLVRITRSNAVYKVHKWFDYEGVLNEKEELGGFKVKDLNLYTVELLT